MTKCLNCLKKIPLPYRTNRKFCSKHCREVHWVTNNRDRHNKAVRLYRAKRYQKDGRWRESGPKASFLRGWLVKLKSMPCIDCGGSFENCCMDFDHRIGTIKANNVGSMFAHHHSVDLIKIELEKCDLVCANCHRIRTRNRRTGSGKSGICPV